MHYRTGGLKVPEWSKEADMLARTLGYEGNSCCLKYQNSRGH